MAGGTAPRHAAFQILRAVRSGQRFEAALDEAVTRLSPPDRRLAHEIAAGVLRTRRELDARLVPLVTDGWRRTPPDLKDLLRVGAYQLLRLSRVPAYAAVQTTVQVAKRRHGRKAAGLVNAILRRLTDGTTQAHGEPASDDLAARFSHPEWLVKRWLVRYGPVRTEALLEHNNRRPTVSLQPVRWTLSQLRAAMQQHNIAVKDAALGEGLIVESARIADLPGYQGGAFIVQDPAQARLLEFAAIPDGALVWDTCAAPGGKAAVLSRRCRVVASELDRHRLTRLRSTVTRAAPEVSLVAADARYPPVRADHVDAILVDSPCSATGTFLRHPDARWRLTPRRLARLVALQVGILDGVVDAVRPGGLLVYLTCSLEPEENDEQVTSFVERHPEFAREGDDLFIFPPDAGTDGGYGARLRRTG